MIQRNRLVQRVILEALYEQALPLRLLNYNKLHMDLDVNMREFEILEDKGMLQKFQKRENPDLYPDPKDKEKIESQTNQDYKVV